MAKAVLIQNPQSIYRDRPGEAYHFPALYLGRMQQTVGDWVVFYQSRQGLFGYVGVQRVRRIVEDPETAGHYYALLDRGTEWSFERVVARADAAGMAYETALRAADGRPGSGGANVSAVRLIPEADFAAIVAAGLTATEGPDALQRRDTGALVAYGFAEDGAEFVGPAPLAGFRPEALTSRKLRDASFARQVKAAYGARCAMSGLALRNGDGRPEVEAAHIRPVAEDGPDTVRNGLALSGTLHWMFDRGLVSVDGDGTILVARDSIADEVKDRLLVPDRRIIAPRSALEAPHPEYLGWHRREVFKG
jgi:putative restriction endonuclease